MSRFCFHGAFALGPIQNEGRVRKDWATDTEYGTSHSRGLKISCWCQYASLATRNLLTLHSTTWTKAPSLVFAVHPPTSCPYTRFLGTMESDGFRGLLGNFGVPLGIAIVGFAPPLNHVTLWGMVRNKQPIERIDSRTLPVVFTARGKSNW